MRLATHSRAVLSSAAAAFVAATLCAAPASAAGTVSAECPAVATVQPFAPWQDMAAYFLAPSGDLEGGAAAWRLQGATAVEGNEPFKVGAASDHRSLRISADGSATTAPMCIAVEHRTMRFFANGPASGKLAVSAVGTKRNGKETAVRLGVIDGSGAWAPTPVVGMRFDDLTEKFQDTLNVSLQFEPKGDGAWQIDDVYVDPYRSN